MSIKLYGSNGVITSAFLLSVFFFDSVSCILFSYTVTLHKMACSEAVVSVSQKAYETETTIALWAESICKNLPTL
jgi:hypothetical protein